jgi:predicted metal-dependent HD superfamily phosphohydrolase
LLKGLFIHTVKKYTGDQQLIQNMWEEIESAYSAPYRHYHTLSHLEHLVNELTPYQHDIADWDTLVFSLFYHDIVYNTLKQNNEERSAVVAQTRLQTLDVSHERIKKCVEQIMITKTHTESDDLDTNLLTDADLSILGAPWPQYETYLENIRKEYKYYPDVIYKPGRKRVVHYFLQMEKIYKTAPFYERYEQHARQNLTDELKQLC